jgi:hypothetical protein
MTSYTIFNEQIYLLPNLTPANAYRQGSYCYHLTQKTEKLLQECLDKQQDFNKYKSEHPLQEHQPKPTLESIAYNNLYRDKEANLRNHKSMLNQLLFHNELLHGVEVTYAGGAKAYLFTCEEYLGYYIQVTESVVEVIFYDQEDASLLQFKTMQPINHSLPNTLYAGIPVFLEDTFALDKVQNAIDTKVELVLPDTLVVYQNEILDLADKEEAIQTKLDAFSELLIKELFAVN